MSLKGKKFRFGGQGPIYYYFAEDVDLAARQLKERIMDKRVEVAKRINDNQDRLLNEGIMTGLEIAKDLIEEEFQ